MTEKMTDAEAALFDAGLQEGFRKGEEINMRRWAIDCARSEPNMLRVEDQIAHAERLFAWVMGEGDGGKKTPDRAAA